jgi:hypothetical protein
MFKQQKSTKLQMNEGGKWIEHFTNNRPLDLQTGNFCPSHFQFPDIQTIIVVRANCINIYMQFKWNRKHTKGVRAWRHGILNAVY